MMQDVFEHGVEKRQQHITHSPVFQDLRHLALAGADQWVSN